MKICMCFLGNLTILSRKRIRNIKNIIISSQKKF
jgi:hypothetical protein